MADSITTRVLDALANAGLLTVEQITSVTSAAQSSGGTPGDVLIQRGMITPADVETVMEDELGIPRVDLSSYAPDDEALRIVPIEMATQRNMLPLFEIEGMLTIAIGDPMDVFKLDMLAIDLGLEIEAVLSDTASVRGAVVQYYTEAGITVSAPTAGPTAESILAEEPVIDAADFFEAPVVDDGPIVAESPFTEEAKTARVEPVQTIADVVETAAPAGPPAIDLDVLAVADTRKVALLVSEILEHAVAKGANRIQLLPYKGDFFLVYRVHGRLEKIASAPLSMQVALVDGFKNFAKLSSVESSRPALGRLKAHINDRTLVVTVSAVPTIAGHRVVISLAADKPAPRGLDDLGMNDAEQRALQVMVERGRGILLVCAPVAGGRSSTYYALLNHAAHIGKTVYSVERAIEYEIPAVAQVLVSPGSPVGAEGYFAAGMRQDTDVVAIDSMQSVEDMHLAVEAAGLGKLVIATFSGGDIVSGVRRMLDLGAEPVSLASALTLGVGQRLVRMNCPSCTAEKPSPLLAKIPGADKSITAKAGSGCPACMNTGFQGATAIFEVLPFTEQVRSPIARGGSGAEIAEAARAAGMRSMISSGLLKVNEGLVSPEELNRVLRFA